LRRRREVVTNPRQAAPQCARNRNNLLSVTVDGFTFRERVHAARKEIEKRNV